MSFIRLALLASLAVTSSACYQTRVRSGTAVGVTHEHRQWFTIGGFVDLSDPAGDECAEAGVAESDSRYGGTDILINVGLSIVGGIAGAALCPLEDDPSRDEARRFGTCVSASAGVLPFLLGSRTVAYRCKGG
jgi:hypothetical protein